MRKPYLMLLWIVLAVPAAAQHEMHAPRSSDEVPTGRMESAAPAMAGMMHEHPVGIPATRHGSGTSWLPDSTPMYGLMRHQKHWNLMYHGAAHLAYDKQNGPRGDEKLVLLNWGMLMATRKVGVRDQWRLAGMMSLDPETVGGSGYPLLFQTGETWRGEPLIDHQHPHNFFMELSSTYTHSFTSRSAGYIYLAPVGEPALGPVTYMHRTFALDDPFAPLGHHWQDSTHIAYGVVTAGYQKPAWQLEVSTFNGREPGENRYEIEGPEFDSFSGRLSYNPSPNWALQASHGFLKSPEALHPEDDTHRTIASAIYNRPLGSDRNFQSTLVWGRNSINGLDLDSFLLEGQLKRDGGWSFYGRYEWIEKNAEELVLPPAFSPDDVFNLQQITVGVSRDLPIRGSFQWGIGLQVNFNLVPDELTPVYGNNPDGWLLYLRAHPKRMAHTAATY